MIASDAPQLLTQRETPEAYLRRYTCAECGGLCTDGTEGPRQVHDDEAGGIEYHPRDWLCAADSKAHFARLGRRRRRLAPWLRKELEWQRGWRGQTQELIKRIEDLEKKAEEPARLFVTTWKAALWFAIPFATLWSLGVDPLVAARVAVAPFVVAALLVLVVTWSLTLSMRVMLWWARHDAEQLGD